MADDVKIAFHVDDRELDQTSHKLQGLGQTATQAGKEGGQGLSGMLSSVSQLGFGIFGLQQTFTGLTGAVKGLFSSNIQFEGFNTQFEVLLGSAGAAKDRMKELADFAKNTPFELPQVVQASKILETFGGSALSTGEGLRLVGDVASGVGQPINELATWFGRLYDGLQSGRPVGEAMARLQEMGAMSGQTRSKIEDLAKSGADGSVVWATFAESMGKYSGMMEKQSATVGGAMSNISDGIGQMKRNLMAGIFDAAKPGIMALASWLGSDGVQGAVESVGKAIGEFISGGVNLLASAITAVIGPIKTFVSMFLNSPLGQWITDHKSLVTQLLTFGPAMTLIIHNWDKLKDAAGTAKDALFEVRNALADLAAKLDLKGKFDDLKSSMTDAFGAMDVGEKFDNLKSSIAGIGMDDFVSAWDKLTTALQPAIDILRPLAEDVLTSLKDAVAPIAKAFSEDLLPALKGLEPAGQVLLPLLEAIGKIIGVVIVAALAALLIGLKLLVELLTVGIVAAIKGAALLIQGLGAAFEAVAPIVTAAINGIVPLLSALGSGIKTAFDGVVSAIQALSPVWDMLVAHFNTGIAVLSLGWEIFKTAFTTVWALLKLEIETGLAIIKGLFNVVMGLITGDWEQAWNGIKAIAKAVWEGIKGVVQIGLDAVSSAITNWWPKVKELFSTGLEEVKLIFSNMVSFTLTVGKDIVMGLWNGIRGQWDAFISDITNLFDKLPGPIKKILGINSPSTVFYEIGENIALGLADGLEAGFERDVMSQMSGWAPKIKSLVGDALAQIPGGSGAGDGVDLSAGGGGGSPLDGVPQWAIDNSPYLSGLQKSEIATDIAGAASGANLRGRPGMDWGWTPGKGWGLTSIIGTAKDPFTTYAPGTDKPNGRLNPATGYPYNYSGGGGSGTTIIVQGNLLATSEILDIALRQQDLMLT